MSVTTATLIRPQKMRTPCPYLRLPLSILCSGFEIYLPFSPELSYFVLKVGVLLIQFNSGFNRSSNIKGPRSGFQCSIQCSTAE